MEILNARDERPKKHDYSVTLRSGKWEVKVSPATWYGYFEHDQHGEGGGLWFETHASSTEGDAGRKLALIDYDGWTHLPDGVATALRDGGFIVGEEFDNDKD